MSTRHHHAIASDRPNARGVIACIERMAPAAGAGAAARKGIVDSLSHPLTFPPFSVDWVDETRLVVTGGGGASRTGVPNGVWLYLVRASPSHACVATGGMRHAY